MTDRSGYRGYITSTPFMGERVPQHIQNLAIRDYANRRDLSYLLSATEYAMSGCFMMLEAVVGELPTLKGMICYSIFQLPPKTTSRRRIYDRFLDQGAELRSAVEGIVIREQADIVSVENTWLVRKALASCPTSLTLRSNGL